MNLPAIINLTKLFLDNNYKKKIITNNIYDLIIPIALSIWIMTEGEQQPSGINICTNSFSIK